MKHGYGDTIKTDRGYFKQTSESEVTNFHEKYGEPDEQVSWKNNYVVLAENRPLMALFEMRRQKFLDETEYQLQFRLFYQVHISVIVKVFSWKTIYQKDKIKVCLPSTKKRHEK